MTKQEWTKSVQEAIDRKDRKEIQDLILLGIHEGFIKMKDVERIVNKYRENK